MGRSSRRKFDRRDIVRSLGALAASSYLLPMSCDKSGGKKSNTAPGADGLALTQGQKRKFLFVFTAMGGASINDSFMAVGASESKNYKTLNAYPDQVIVRADGYPFSAVDMDHDTIGPLPFSLKSRQSPFLARNARDLMVATVSGTSVAHPTAQFRSITGDNAWNGRTLQEAVAMQYGADLPLANVNMSTVGFARDGLDSEVAAFARAQTVADPRFFPLGLHGYLGQPGLPEGDLINLARSVRDNVLEPQSAFYRKNGESPLIAEWFRQRNLQKQLEDLQVINSLNGYEETEDAPFSDVGLTPNPMGDSIRKVLHRAHPRGNFLHNQALLAYLLVTQGLTCTVTFGMGQNLEVDVKDGTDEDTRILNNVPTGFDYAHNAHRGAQALGWHHTLDVIDRLITLLKATEYQNGESYWDHSMIYIATEFGRDKDRPELVSEFASGHHTNNGVVVISPLANGGNILGGIDKETLLTYGFDGQTGTPIKDYETKEKEIYAGILHALEVDTKGSGLPDMRAMRRKG